MKDIKVDWSLSPKGATELVKVALIGQKWRNSKTKQYWDMNGDFGGYYSESSPIDEAKVFAIRPQIAVVTDAVEQPNFKATRENLEKIAKDAQGDFVEVEEGEKWTHTDAFDNPCRILIDEPDSNGNVIIIRQDGWYAPVAASSIKPIKPTIKPSAAWSLVSKQGWPIHQVTETYDVEEVLAND